MLDIKVIRENPEFVRQQMQALQDPSAPVDKALALDEERRRLLAQVEELKALRNAESKRVGQLMREGARAEADALKNEMTQVGDQIKTLDDRLKIVDQELFDAMSRIPNLPLPFVPVGKDDSENVVVRTWGQPRQFDFQPLPHWDIGEALGILDFERGVKLSGSRFYLLKGLGARLQRALIAWMLDVHIQEHGYSEIYPPYIVRAQTLFGTGNLPKFAENLYRDAEDDLWLIPTAEVPVTNLYRDEILPPGSLPIYHVAYTPCFRREKMSAGKDVRGIKRGHQFDKVEMVKFVEPEQGEAELASLVDNAEEIARRLEHPLPRGADVYRRPGLLGRGQVRHRAVGARLRRVAGGQLLLALRPTFRPAAPTSATGRRKAPSRASSIPSTAPAWPCRAC
jgi:seryl-tRNA synthetase